MVFFPSYTIVLFDYAKGVAPSLIKKKNQANIEGKK